ncbi:MAG TPA: ArsA-related P-loop ATPase [Solirubrobacteraceae bacterium]
MTRTPSVLERRLVVVTGKGGVGKTTIAAALGLAAAERGLRTIVVELGDQRRLPALWANASQREDGRSSKRSDAGEEASLGENLWSVTIDPDRALLEWLQALGGRVPGRVLAGSGTFQYFAAAAPGAKELVSMVKVWELTRGAERWRRRAGSYDLVVLDAPATGHALGLLHSPRTFGAIARVGPIFGQAERVRDLLEDEAQTGYLAVTQASDMAVGETLDLREGLRSQLDVELDAAIVNATLPHRFDNSELRQIAGLEDSGAVARAASRTARTVHERARVQHNQIARLRRQGVIAHTVPFVFTPALDLEAVRRIGRRLAERV